MPRTRRRARLRRSAALIALSLGLVLWPPGPAADALTALRDVCTLTEARDGLAAVELLGSELAGYEGGGCAGPAIPVYELQVRVTRSVYGPLSPGEYTVRMRDWGELDLPQLERDGAPTHGYLFYGVLEDELFASQQDYLWFEAPGLLRNVAYYSGRVPDVEGPLPEDELLYRVAAVREDGACPPSAKEQACYEACEPCLEGYACEGHCSVHAACILAASTCDEVTACVQGPQPTCKDVCESCLEDPACRELCSDHGECFAAADTCEEVAACLE